MLGAGKIGHSWKRANLSYALVAAMGLAFIIGSYRAALINHAGSPEYFLLHLSFVLPEVVIWLLAAVGAVQLKGYALSIKDSRDGPGLNYVANALLLFVLYVVLISLTGTASNLVVGTEWEKLVVSIENHAPLAVIFVSSIYLWLGSKKLLGLINRPLAGPWAPSLWFCLRTILFASFALVFTLNFYHFASEVQDQENVLRFGLEPAVLLVTYVLPHLVTWLLGGLACINLAVYASEVTGVIYKQLFRDLQLGVSLVFICTFLAQVLMATVVTDNDFSPLLLLVYLVLALGIAGFYLILRGTRRLERLEK